MKCETSGSSEFQEDARRLFSICVSICDCIRHMHLLAITGSNDRSEIEIYRALVERGHTVDLICTPDWSGESPLIEAGITVTKMEIRHRLDFRAVRSLRERLQSNPPDIIYAPSNKSLSVALLATRRSSTPVVGYRGTTGHLSRWDPASWLTYFHPRLKGIVCVSEAVRQYLLSKRIPADKTHTIHKGHRVEWYAFNEYVDLSEFGIPADAFVIGFTGNIRPVKGVDVLLHSLQSVPESLNVHLLMVGEVRDKKIATMVSSPRIADRVHSIGFRKDAPLLAGGCNAFVMPSVEREGLPRSVIEAMAQRVPAIVSEVGGMPELVEHNVSGLIVPPRDHNALAQAITILAEDRTLCSALGNAARERIQTSFNIDTTIIKIESLFESLIS